MARILLIDDAEDFSEDLQSQLRTAGHDVVWVDKPHEGLRVLAAEGPFDLVLLDNRMLRMTGLEFLVAAKAQGLRTPIILMTDVQKDSTVIEAIKRGAFDYILKPLRTEDLVSELGPLIHKALEEMRRPRPPIRPAEPGDEDDSLIVGRSKPIVKVLIRIARAAASDDTVLILGETGTGKDLVARAIHTNSPRRDRQFSVIDCTTLAESLLESELFGYEEGAFTNALKLRKGRFEHADGGTLFLDEVGDMSLNLQAKLLRVLDNQVITRVGGHELIKVDVRVLAATRRDLGTLVAEGKFRDDLYFRLRFGLLIELPALRNRQEDIEPLARHFLARMFSDSSSAPTLAPTLDPAALDRLRAYPWPGNIRELRGVLCRAAGACWGAQIGPQDLDLGESDGTPPAATDAPVNEEGAIAALRQAIKWAWQSQQPGVWPRLQEALERELLRHALAQPGISQVRLAQRLGMAKNTLIDRVKKYGLDKTAEGDG